MDAVLHRIEALPGAGRYAVTFRCADGSEQTAVMIVDGDGRAHGMLGCRTLGSRKDAVAAMLQTH